MVTYGTTVIPSDQITVIEGSTVDVSAAFENSVALVGGMDTANGSATEGDLVEVTDSTDAATKFGEDSELHEQVQLAFQNGAGEVHCLPVAETSVSAETQSSQSGTLNNAPVFDPRVNSEHSLTVTDTGAGSATVNLVDSPPSSAPTDSDTVDVYPPTGEYYADATPDGDYEFTYDYGDYSSTSVAPALSESPRIIGVCTENKSVMNTIASDLNSDAKNFDFMHSVAGTDVDIPDTSTYTDSVDERRVSLTYPARGYRDDAETVQARSVGAVAGYLASLPLGISSTNDSLGGFTGLVNDLGGPSDAGNLIDEDVMPLLDYPPVTIVSDQTTSTTSKFGRVFRMQIADEATEVSHLINRQFVGDQNVSAERIAMRRAHRNAYNEMRDGTPRMLDDYVVNVEEDSADDNKVNVTIGLDIVDVMDTIDVTITVGDVVRGNTQT